MENSNGLPLCLQKTTDKLSGENKMVFMGSMANTNISGVLLNEQQ